jgi:group I intron endonuclease
MTRCIYKIINAVNNNFYVGSAVNFEKRKARHLWRLRRGDHANKYLQAAWGKYGEQAFVFAVVQEVPEFEDILAVENVWLHEHVGKDYCYNIATDATAPQTGMSGEKNAMWGRTFTHTEDAKARIGAASKIRVQSEEEKAKRRQSLKGRVVSISTRTKISATLSGEGNYWYGKKRPDHGIKVSKAVVATDPNGRSTEYASISVLREEMKLKPPTVNRALKSGKPLVRGPYKGWAFKYLDTPQTT